jgi:gag-polypeptide of LTR copia-type
MAKKMWNCLKQHYTPKDGMVLQLVKHELMNCCQKQQESPMDYILRFIAIQNKCTVLGKVLEDKEIVMKYAVGCQAEPKFEV